MKSKSSKQELAEQFKFLHQAWLFGKSKADCSVGIWDIGDSLSLGDSTSEALAGELKAAQLVYYSSLAGDIALTSLGVSEVILAKAQPSKATGRFPSLHSMDLHFTSGHHLFDTTVLTSRSKAKTVAEPMTPHHLAGDSDFADSPAKLMHDLQELLNELDAEIDDFQNNNPAIKTSYTSKDSKVIDPASSEIPGAPSVDQPTYEDAARSARLQGSFMFIEEVDGRVQELLESESTHLGETMIPDPAESDDYYAASLSEDSSYDDMDLDELARWAAGADEFASDELSVEYADDVESDIESDISETHTGAAIGAGKNQSNTPAAKAKPGPSLLFNSQWNPSDTPLHSRREHNAAKPNASKGPKSLTETVTSLQSMLVDRMLAEQLHKIASGEGESSIFDELEEVSSMLFTRDGPSVSCER